MITSISLIIGFFLTIITAWVSFSDKRNDFLNGKSASKNFRLIFITAISGAILSLITNIASYIDKDNSSKQSKILTDSLFRVNNKLLITQDLNTKLLLTQKDSTNRIIEINNSLLSINSKMESVQNILLKNVTGDGNIPILDISPGTGGDNYNTVEFMIWNEGNTPLRGVRATVYDVYSNFFCKDTNEYIKRSFDYRNYDQKEKLRYGNVFIGDRPPDKQGKGFYCARIQNIHSRFFLTIHISWENGSYSCSVVGTVPARDKYPILRLQNAMIGNKVIIKPSFIRVINMMNP